MDTSLYRQAFDLLDRQAVIEDAEVVGVPRELVRLIKVILNSFRPLYLYPPPQSNFYKLSFADDQAIMAQGEEDLSFMLRKLEEKYLKKDWTRN